MINEENYTSIKINIGELDKNLLVLRNLINSKKNFSKSELKSTKNQITKLLPLLDSQLDKIKSGFVDSTFLSREEKNVLEENYNERCKTVIDYTTNLSLKLEEIKFTKGNILDTSNSSFDTNSLNEKRTNDVASKDNYSQKSLSIYDNDETLRLINNIQNKLGMLEKQTNMNNIKLHNNRNSLNDLDQKYDQLEINKDEINKHISKHSCKEYTYTYGLHLILFILICINVSLLIKSIKEILTS